VHDALVESVKKYIKLFKLHILDVIPQSISLGGERFISRAGEDGKVQVKDTI